MKLGIMPSNLDYVLLSHLDCDHVNGLCAFKVKNGEGKYVLLFADGGYATKSWKEMIPSGVCVDKTAQLKSLEWIRQQSMSKDCLASLANHDADIKPHTIEL